MVENEKKKMQHNVQQKLCCKRLSAFGDLSYPLVRRLLHFLFNSSSSSSFTPSRLVPFHSLVVHAVQQWETSRTRDSKSNYYYWRSKALQRGRTMRGTESY